MEHLHIDLVKDTYQATNHQDEYAQMTVWLEQREKVLRHEKYLRWCVDPQPMIVLRSTDMVYNGTLTLTKQPSAWAVDLDDVVRKYGVQFFREALRRYIVLMKHLGPPLTRSQVDTGGKGAWKLVITCWVHLELMCTFPTM